MLYGCYIDVVDRGEVENDGFEGWAVGVHFWSFAAAWSGIVPAKLLIDDLQDVEYIGHSPRTVAWTRIMVKVCAAGSSEDVVCQLIQVVVGIRIVEALRKAVNEHSWVWDLDLNVRVRSITVIEWQEDVSG